MCFQVTRNKKQLKIRQHVTHSPEEGSRISSWNVVWDADLAQAMRTPNMVMVCCDLYRLSRELQ
jgi:hypothetical protein